MYCEQCGSLIEYGASRCPICGNEIIPDNATVVVTENVQNYWNNQTPNMANEHLQFSLGGDVDTTKKKSFLTVSMILGIISAGLMLAGMFVDMIDFSKIVKEVPLHENLLRLCSRVEFFSSMWRAIPVGFFIAIAMMFALSFVRIPILKILPCILAIAIIVLMISDIPNVVASVKHIAGDSGDTAANVVHTTTSLAHKIKKVMNCLMAGAYLMISGICVGLISCFIPCRKD